MQKTIFIVLLSFITFSCNSGENKKDDSALMTENGKEQAASVQNLNSEGLALKGDGNFTVKGKITGAAGKKVILQIFPVFTAGRNQKVNNAGSVMLDESGVFEIPAKVDHKTFGALLIDNAHVAYLVLDGSDIQFTADYNDFSNFSIEGSPESALIKDYFSHLLGMVTRINEARAAVQKAQKSGDKAGVERAKALENQNVDAYFSYVRDYADTTSSPLMALFATGMLEPSLYSDFLMEISNRYKGTADASPYYQRILKLARGQNGLVGQIAPEIRLPNPDGDTLALSDLRGKYVLLDFWAAWCGPCRRENPNVVKLYKKYKDRNFTVFSVSLDKSRQSWIQAIQQDGLEWPNHVSELAFWSTEAIKPYGVRSIPATFLLDPEGRIIAKDLRGYMLEKKLEQLLGK